jgi:hypothetical protein
MILDSKADFYTPSGKEKTSEGKLRTLAPVKYLEDIKCNIQFDDGHLTFEKFGVTASNNDAFLYVEDKRVLDAKRMDNVIVDGNVKYEIEKVIPYSTHIEIILNEVVS